MSDEGGKSIPSQPAKRTPGHAQAKERLGRIPAHIDLAAEIKLLEGEETLERVGRNAKTLVKRPDFRVVLTAIRKGARIAAHTASGSLTVQAIRGCIRMQTEQGVVELSEGQVLALEREERHDVEALENSVFLLTIAWPEGNPGGLESKTR